MMNNEQAIEFLKIIDSRYPCSLESTFNDECERIALNMAVQALKNEQPQGQWIPITYRPLTVEERIAFAEHYGIEYCDTSEEKAFDCPMPEDGQHILLSRSCGVDIDVAYNDIDGEGFICYGLEGNGDWSGVDAWKPLPEPYKKEGA